MSPLMLLLGVIALIAILGFLPFAKDIYALLREFAAAWWVRAAPVLSPVANTSSSVFKSWYIPLVIGIIIGASTHLITTKIDLPDIIWPNNPSPSTPTDPPVTPAPTTKPTKATYVYEKDDTDIPTGISVAIDKLNRQGILASIFEEDTLDNDGTIPTQYIKAKAEATKVGLPALVIESDKVVLKVIKAPQTETEVLESIAP